MNATEFMGMSQISRLWCCQPSKLLKGLNEGYGRHQLMLSFHQMEKFLLVIDNPALDIGFN